MDRFGRKRTIQIGAAIATLGGVLQCAAMNLPMILVGRIVAGWAVGLMSMSVPVYQAECAHPNIRGMIVGLTQQMIGVGFIISTWVGYGSRHTSDASSFQWRFPLGFQIIPSVLLLVGLIWLPESPRYLIEKYRDEDGMRILRKLHYNGSNDEWIQTEYNEIRATLSAEKAITAPGWAVMFKVPQWRKRLLLGTLIQVFTQLTGISKYMTGVITSMHEHSTDIPSRRHRILPNHHVQCVGDRRSPRCACRRHIQLRGTDCQSRLHLLHPRPRGSQEASPSRSIRHYTCSVRRSWTQCCKPRRHADWLLHRWSLLPLPGVCHFLSFLRPYQLGVHERDHAYADQRSRMRLRNRDRQLAGIHFVRANLSYCTRSNRLGESARSMVLKSEADLIPRNTTSSSPRSTLW